VAVVSSSHPWAARPWVDARALASEQLFADERALDVREPLGGALARAGQISPKKVTHVPMTGGVALDLVRAGLGITVLPRWTVTPQLHADELSLVRVTKRGLWLNWYLATRRETADPALERFLAIVRAEHPVAAAQPRAR
jgi:LysR family transcriptional regulator, regulator for metE and metH